MFIIAGLSYFCNKFLLIVPYFSVIKLQFYSCDAHDRSCAYHFIEIFKTQCIFYYICNYNFMFNIKY